MRNMGKATIVVRRAAHGFIVGFVTIGFAPLLAAIALVPDSAGAAHSYPEGSPYHARHEAPYHLERWLPIGVERIDLPSLAAAEAHALAWAQTAFAWQMQHVGSGLCWACAFSPVTPPICQVMWRNIEVRGDGIINCPYSYQFVHVDTGEYISGPHTSHFGYSLTVFPVALLKVVISSTDISNEPQGPLVSVEPGKTTNLIARVYDQNGQPVPNVKVKLEVTVAANSGGHQHHDGDRPKGLLSNGVSRGAVVEGNTGSDGMPFTFIAPAPAGDHKIIATCTDRACTQDGPDTVWVGIKGLIPLGNSQYFVPIGDTANHFDNHYLTIEAASRIGVLAVLYRTRFPDNPLLHLNDASLERGGVFDIGSNWKPPHFEHCRGTEIDIRGNDALGAIPSTQKHQDEFRELAGVVGADSKFEVPKDKNKKPAPSLRHYHVRLLGGIPQCP